MAEPARVRVSISRKLSKNFNSVGIDASLEEDVPKGKTAQVHAKAMVKRLIAIASDTGKALSREGW